MSYLLVFTRTEHLQKVSSPKIGGILEPKNIWKMTKSAVKSVSGPTYNFWLSFHLFICCLQLLEDITEWLINVFVWYTAPFMNFKDIFFWTILLKCVSSASHTWSSFPDVLCSNPFYVFFFLWMSHCLLPTHLHKRWISTVWCFNWFCEYCQCPVAWHVWSEDVSLAF